MPSTFGANALQHVLGRMHMEVVGHRDGRQRKAAQTIGAVTALTGEVEMQVAEALGIVAMAMLGTGGILHDTRAIIDAMYQVAVEEQVQRAGDGGLVHRTKAPLQFGKRQGIRRLLHGTQYKQAHRCGAHVVSDKLLFYFFSVLQSGNICFYRVRSMMVMNTWEERNAKARISAR